MRWIGAALLAVVLLGGAGALVVRGQLEAPYRGFDGAEQLVEIPPGTSVAGIGARLVAAGVVSDPYLFRLALWQSGKGARLKAGTYRFADAAPVTLVIERLARGDVFLRKLTIREGLTIADMARVFEERGFGAADDFVRAAQDATLIADLDPEARDLEGYLFPETYPLPYGATATMLVRAMVERFKTVCTPALREQAAAQGLTVRHLVSLAAIVEKEAAAADERPVVAAVYRNRLRIRMPMQADPTLIYALQRRGHYDGNIRKGDLSVDSPYNTYRYPGLPPGPIAAPGEAALRAAANPAQVPFLYFVSRNDGTHVFSETLAEHNRNVQRFQVQYFRQKRLAAAQASR